MAVAEQEEVGQGIMERGHGPNEAPNRRVVLNHARETIERLCTAPPEKNCEYNRELVAVIVELVMTMDEGVFTVEAGCDFQELVEAVHRAQNQLMAYNVRQLHPV